MTPEPRDMTGRRVEAIARELCRQVSGERNVDEYWPTQIIRAQLVISADPATALLERAAEVLTDVRRELCGVPFGSEHAIDALLTELRTREG